MARVARQVSGKESTHGLKVLDQVPAKVGTGSPWPRQITFSVGRPLGLLYVKFRQAALAACLSFGCNHDVLCQPGPGYIRNQYTASQCSEACLCIQVRFCFSPARVSLYYSFHMADGFVLSLSVFGCFCVVALLGLAVADRICPSVVVVFESIVPLTSRSGIG